MTNATGNGVAEPRGRIGSGRTGLPRFLELLYGTGLRLLEGLPFCAAWLNFLVVRSQYAPGGDGMKICSIHTTEKQVIVFREHTLPGSDYCSLVPMVKLERVAVTAESLGQAVMEALDAPGLLQERVDFQQAVAGFSGFKTLSAFANATESSCALIVLGGQVKITPTFRVGRGFSGDTEKIVFCECNAAALGKTLLAVLGLV